MPPRGPESHVTELNTQIGLITPVSVSSSAHVHMAWSGHVPDMHEFQAGVPVSNLAGF